MAEAAKLKTKANEAFGLKSFAKAAALYTEALVAEASPKFACLILLNRGFTSFKAHRITDAEHDFVKCEEIGELPPRLEVKLYYRLGLCALAQRKTTQAEAFCDRSNLRASTLQLPGEIE